MRWVVVRWPWTHRCKFSVVEAQESWSVHSNMFAGEEKRRCTIVLLRCECGRFESRFINGTWSLDLLRGMSSAEVVDKFIASMSQAPK